MTFLNKFIAFIKAMFVHIHLSLRVKISRRDDCNEEKAKEETEIGGKEDEQSSLFRD